MTDMNMSLDQISSEYTVFEEDQVLTHEQLNEVIDYLGDQERLTRVDLVGVGIYCGLRATLGGDHVRLTRGVGVTTDGDIARVTADVEHTLYRRYDDIAPRYDKLAPGGVPIRTWELLPADTVDPRAAPLGGFEAGEGVPLSSLCAVLLVESVVRDEDFCSGTDCDNRGDTAAHTVRLLLVDAVAAAQLTGAFHTPDAAARALDDVVADRPLLTGITTMDGLVAVYRGACDAIHAKLVSALPKIQVHAGGFLWDGPDPTPEWIDRLTKLKSAYSAESLGIQYYHDHLRDIVETYGALRERLSGDAAVCVPDVGSFPKHLVLGRIVPGSGDEARVGFYPSPLVRAAVDRLGHARFLARKLGLLLSAWRLPSSAGSSAQTGVRVTPSQGEDRSLEERAIPYYYDPSATPAVHEGWSFALSRRGMGRSNLSYHAPEYGGQGEAAKPLESALGRFSFFRVEGQLGRDVDDVIPVLEATIRKYNLPITIAAALLPASAEAGGGASDLIDAFNAVRAQLAGEIEQVATSARRAVSRVESNVNTRKIAIDTWPLVLQLESRASAARSELALPYEGFEASTTWRAAVGDVTRLAAQIRVNLGNLMMSWEAAPFDALAKSAAVQNIELLRTEIQAQERKAARPLFTAFLQQQPGLEHFAGVRRGATLLLVHDDGDQVIADFMLPCCNCEVVAEEDREAGGAREAVTSVFAWRGAFHDQPVRRGMELPADRLAGGLRFAAAPNLQLDGVSEADCTVTLEVPFPQTMADVGLWGAPSIGHQPVMLAGTVSTSAGDLIWRPIQRTERWLRGTLPEILGRPRVDFFTGSDEKAPGWSIGVQHQLVYGDSSSRPLETGLPVLGGAAVFQRPASNDDVAMRVYWSVGLTYSLTRLQTGIIYEFNGRDDFSVLLCEGYITYAGGGGGIGAWTELTTSLSDVHVRQGIARWITTERVRSRRMDSGPSLHPPFQMTIDERGVEIIELAGGAGTVSPAPTPWRSSKIRVSALGKRIGAFTTVPAEIWELSDGVQSLQPLHDARVRARAQIRRGAVAWVGPPGLARPFVPDFELMFWLRVGWPIAYGYGSLGSPPYGYGLTDEYPGIGAELIK